MLKRTATRISAASLSPFGGFLLRFLRMVVLSRMLAPHNLGAALALLSILAIAELITDVGLDRFVLVTHRQSRAQAVAAARQVALLRAAFLAVVIAAFAPVIAWGFSIEDRVWTVAMLGLVPLIGGFKNWRISQVQQDYRYGPDAIVNIGGQLAALLSAVAAVIWLRDERVVLVSLLAEVVTNVVLSHVVVPAEPVARVDPAIRRAAFLFGLPLMVNGVGLAAMKQFDQVIVVNFFDLQSLALYGLGLNLALAPASLLQIVAQKLGLPFLGNASADANATRLASLAAMIGFTGLGALYALGVGAMLDLAVPLIYGRQYVVSEAFCAMTMLLVFLRVCRAGPNLILLHQGRTRRLTIGNLAASVGLVASLSLAAVSGRIEGVIGGLVIGEVVSLGVLLVLIRRDIVMTTLLAHLCLLSSVTALGAGAFWLAGEPTLAQRAMIIALSCLVIGVDAAFAYRKVARPLVERARQRTTYIPLRSERDTQPLLVRVSAEGDVAG
jgi:O-antigen/teichoic acid export membrane protein